jgi:hypothetical protein
MKVSLEPHRGQAMSRYFTTGLISFGGRAFFGLRRRQPFIQWPERSSQSVT